LQWVRTQRFDGLYSSRGRAGASLCAGPGHYRQDVPVFGATRLCAVQVPGTAEARTSGSADRCDPGRRQDGAAEAKVNSTRLIAYSRAACTSRRLLTRQLPRMLMRPRSPFQLTSRLGSATISPGSLKRLGKMPFGMPWNRIETKGPRFKERTP
jgi:hypothetical protein